MKQSLQLRLGQQITMTPQLQQAIRLLQLSTLDLQLEIQQALESNIMLEVAEEQEDQLDNSEEDISNKEEFDAKSEDSGDAEERDASNEEVCFDNADTIPDDMAVDSSWDDMYDNTLSSYDYPTSNNNAETNGKDILNQNVSSESLQDHLRWQLDLTPFSDVDRAIALAIIDAIDNDGFLQSSVEEILASLGEIEEDEVELDEVTAVLHRLQHFDPAGVAARDLSECLALQLKVMPEETEWRGEALQLAQQHLVLLANRDFTQLQKKLKLNKDQLREVVDLIQSLNPRPGSHISAEKTSYIVPDVFVRKVKGEWRVDLNSEIAPRLRVNEQYANLINRVDGDAASLKNHLQEARWFIKSLQSRHETLLKVAKCIVKRQSAFLDYGEEAMKPLVLHDIASELEMHESTISRVTTQKYLHTPRGIFELKYFFSSHVSTDSGGECSSTAIRALIKKLIAAENVAKPLSDSKIADILAERGIKVARRTVAKYREAMVIPPSNERKRLV